MRIRRDWLRLRAGLLLCLACVVFVACGDDAPGDAGGDTPTRPAAAEPPAYELTEDLRIGSLDEGPAAFGEVVALEADALGRVYVADAMAGEVRVFDPAGNHLRTLGRKGAGPGEFRRVTGLAWTPAGDLWVMDAGSSRFTRFDTAGAFSGTVRRPSSRILTTPWAGRVADDGSVYDVARRGSGEGASGGVVLVRYAVDGEALVAMDTMPLESPTAPTYEVRVEGMRLVRPVPLTPAPVWSIAPDGSGWTGRSDRYRLDRVSFSGDTLATVERTVEPIDVSAAERDSIAREDRVEPERIPLVKPVLGAQFVDARGRLWVRSIASGHGTRWDVFSADGTFIAEVATSLLIDTGMPQPMVRGRHLYGVTRDDADVQYVVRMLLPDVLR